MVSGMSSGSFCCGFEFTAFPFFELAVGDRNAKAFQFPFGTDCFVEVATVDGSFEQHEPINRLVLFGVIHGSIPHARLWSDAGNRWKCPNVGTVGNAFGVGKDGRKKKNVSHGLSHATRLGLFVFGIVSDRFHLTVLCFTSLRDVPFLLGL
jgi:hypothetical protein